MKQQIISIFLHFYFCSSEILLYVCLRIIDIKLEYSMMSSQFFRKKNYNEYMAFLNPLRANKVTTLFWADILEFSLLLDAYIIWGNINIHRRGDIIHMATY